MNKKEKNIYTVNPCNNFLRELAKLVLEKCDVESNPLALASVKIILPNHRSSLSLKKEIIELSENKVSIMPRMVTLGDFEEEDLSYELVRYNESIEEIRPSIPKTKRIILLAELINKISDDSNLIENLSFKQSVKLAYSIAEIIDETHRYQKPFENIENILPDELAQNKQASLEFLKEIFDEYPKRLSQEGYLDVIDRRNLVIEKYSEYLNNKEIEDYIFIAGSTGSMPATRKMIEAILNSQNGYIILPYTDLEISENIWRKLNKQEEEINHQSSLKNLLDDLDIGRNQIKTLGDSATNASNRTKFISDVYLPSSDIDAWKISKVDKVENLNVLETQNPIDEARVASLIIRENLEENKKIALVTNERDLAKYCREFLKKFDINIDDSAGKKLHHTSEGRFLSETAGFISNNSSVVCLLNILKSKYSTFGKDRANFRDDIFGLEKNLIRKESIVTNERLLEKIKKIKRKSSLESIIEEFLNEKFEDLGNSEFLKISEIANNHWNLISTLSPNIAEEFDGTLLKQINEVFDILKNSSISIKINKNEYAEIFKALISTITVRGKFGFTPSVSILSPIEARLEFFDTVILAGVNIDSWPSISHSVWLNRNMKKDYGLPLEEMFISLASHDFTSFLHFNEVYITRSKYKSGRNLIESPLITRLKAFCEQKDLSLTDERGTRFLEINENLKTSSNINQAANSNSKNQIYPKPNKDLRKRKISLTAIEKILLNPYHYFANNILELRKLNDLEVINESLEYGNFLHKFMQNFANLHNGNENLITRNNFDKTLLETTEKWKEENIYNEIWEARISKLSSDIIKSEIELSKSTKEIFTEIATKVDIQLSDDSNFCISTKADRIEILKGNDYRVIDIKTGGFPDNREVTSLRSPQLPLTASFLISGFFKEINAKIPKINDCENLAYYTIKEDAKNIGLVKIKFNSKDSSQDEVIEEAISHLKELCEDLANDNTPLVPFPTKKSKSSYSDYFHLARIDYEGSF